MFSIGEFSRITSLPVKTLRFYHEKGLLVPAAVEPGSGYRYYSKENVDSARVILTLRKMDFSLSEIGEILHECHDEADLFDYFVQRRESVQSEIRRQQDIASMLDGVIRTERETRALMKKVSFDVEEKAVEAVLIAGIRMKGKYSDCGQGFAKLGKLVGRYICGKPMCLYYDGEYRENDADFEACFPIRKPIEIDGVSVRELPAARCVSLMHQGPYDQLGRSYEIVFAHANDKGYSIELPTREVYIKGPGMIFRGNPKKYVTEILLPMK